MRTAENMMAGEFDAAPISSSRARGDPGAAARAAALHAHTAAVRLVLTRRRHRAPRADVIPLVFRRARSRRRT
ncbi:hypothetical protein [Rhodococcus opacus]|uniref:hypothetical protein n=1 Tax=Rhodococcus opacus TaxID=37919 RepID=UPI00155B405A|nr:hypothetical protein [Rhodococcus opacus]